MAGFFTRKDTKDTKDTKDRKKNQPDVLLQNFALFVPMVK
jgi:hypothetical protein